MSDDEARADEVPAEDEATVAEGGEAIDQQVVEQLSLVDEPPAADDREASLAAVASGLDAAEQPSEESPASVEAPEDLITVLDPDAAPDVDDAPARARRPIVPYLVYGAAWIALAAVTYVVLRGSNDPLAAQTYAALVWTGVGLAGVAPLVVLWGWLSAHRRAEDRRGILSSAMLRTALVMALGVAVWWGALVALDAARGAL